jgi:hypothetical protein
MWKQPSSIKEEVQPDPFFHHPEGEDDVDDDIDTSPEPEYKKKRTGGQAQKSELGNISDMAINTACSSGGLESKSSKVEKEEAEKKAIKYPKLILCT